MRRLLNTAAVCLLLAGFGGMAFAQDTVNSTLYGTITDLSSGKPVAKAAVIATSVFGAFSAESDSAGRYRIPFLKPGSYDVRVEASGFATIIQQDVTLSLGSGTELPFSLAAGKTETMTVTGESSPVVDRSTTAIGANISSELMESIPLGRNFNNAFYLAPGVNTSAPANGTGTDGPNSTGIANPSVSGGSGLENNFVVDGINITDSGFGALGAYSRVFGSLGTAVNFNFIKEIQVKTGGYEPEYGQSTGGVINAITKSGSNSVSGDVFWYYTGRDLQQDARVTPTPNGDANLAQNGFNENDIGFAIGGPFVKDRFFWYAAYNRVQRDTDVFGASTSPGQLFYDEANPVRREFEADNWSLKFTWQVTANHRVELSGFGDPSSSSFSANRNAALFVQTDDTTAFSELEFGGQNYILRYDGVITPNFLIEAFVAQANSEFKEKFPEINNQPAVRDRRTNYSQSGGTDPNQFLGGVGFFENTDHQNTQFTLKLTNFIGNHELKYGAIYEDIEFTGIRNRTGDTWAINRPGTAQNGEMSTSGPSIQIICDDTLIGIIPNAPGGTCINNTGDGNALDRPAIMRVSRGQISPNDVTTSSTYIAPFIQDSWQSSPYFTFKFGVRYEQQEVSGGGVTSSTFEVSDSWAPRLGFTWDVAHNGKSKFYGSAGRFYSKIAQDLALRALSADASITRGDYYWVDPQVDTNGDGVINQVDGVNSALQNPIPDPTPVGTSRFIIPGASLTIVDEGVENSYADEFNIGFEYEVRPNLALGANMIYRELGTIMEDIAQNYASEVADGTVTFGTYFITNPDTSTPSYHGPFNTAPDGSGSGCDFLNFPGFIIDDPTTPQCFPASTATDFPNPERKYFALLLTMDKRLSNNWQLLASYRLSRSSGNYEGFFRSDNAQTDPNLTSLFDFPDEDIWLFTYANGVLPTNRTHIVRINGSYRFNFGSTLGMSWNILAGAPLTTYDAHPAYDNAGELVVEPRGNQGGSPTLNIVDFHFDYPLKLGKTDLKFFLDVFNVFDATDSVSFTQDREVSVGNFNPDFTSCAGTGTGVGCAIASNPPRRVRLGIQFSF